MLILGMRLHLPCFFFPLWYDIVHTQSVSCVELFESPWTVARQAPLSMEFPRQEYWSGLPFPHPRDLSNPRIEPASPASPAGRFLTTELPGEPARAAFLRFRNYSITPILRKCHGSHRSLSQFKHPFFLVSPFLIPQANEIYYSFEPP